MVRADVDDDLRRCASWCAARRRAGARWTLAELVTRPDDPRRVDHRWLTRLAHRWNAVVVVSAGLVSKLPRVWRDGFALDCLVGWSVDDLEPLESPSVGRLFDWPGSELPLDVCKQLVAMSPRWAQLSIRMGTSDGLQVISGLATAVAHALVDGIPITYRATMAGSGVEPGASVLALGTEAFDDVVVD